MNFLNGTHVTNISTNVYFYTSFIKMIGESHSQNVSVECSLPESQKCALYFTNSKPDSDNLLGAYLLIENLEMTQFILCMRDYTSLMPLQNEVQIISVILNKVTVEFQFINAQVYIQYVVMNSSTVMAACTTEVLFTKSSLYGSFIGLLGAIDTKMEDCKLTNSRILMDVSSANFLGVTELIGAGNPYASMISSYSSNITLSGTILFANNSGIRGGAMALYSSTLNVAPGVNVTFVNNSALDKGGAIYIEPGLVLNSVMMMTSEVLGMINRIVLPHCFYQTLNCSDSSKYNFCFANNSAVYGGEDVYGASLKLSGSICQTSESGNCRLTVSGVSSGLSSVSSDPVSYTHLRAHETLRYLVCRLVLE